MARQKLKRNGPLRREDAASDASDDPRFNSAVARGLEMLAAFRAGDTYLGNVELSERTGIPNSTTSRLTFTLQELGHLVYVESLGRYQLGPSVLKIGASLMATLPVPEGTEARMAALADDSSAVVSLAARDGLHMVYLMVAAGQAPFIRSAHVGTTIPAAHTSAGWACLAAMPAAERQALLLRHQAALGVDWPSVRKQMFQAFREVEERGFCLNIGGRFVPSLNAVGSPVRIPFDGRDFALNLTTPGVLHSREAMLDRWGPRLADIARHIETHAGASAGSRAGRRLPPRQRVKAQPALSSATGRARKGQKEDLRFISAVARGLDILTAFGPGDFCLTNSQLAERTRIPVSTINRLTFTLHRLGYLLPHESEGCYTLTPSVLKLGVGALSTIDIQVLARPLMMELANECGGVVSLAARDGDQMVHIEVAKGLAPLTRNVQVGTHIPIARTSMGWACMWAMKAADLDTLFDALEQSLGTAWPPIRRQIGGAFREIDSRGFCLNTSGRNVPGLHAVGVPLRSHNDPRSFALNITAPAAIVSRADMLDTWGPKLVELGRRIQGAGPAVTEGRTS